MPLFEYVCQCGNKFEAIMPIDQRDEAQCPGCGGLARKKLSVFNFTFGFRLSDESMWVKGHKDEFVRDI